MGTMVEQTFQPGDGVFVACDAPGQPNSAFFEDDGETAYFYAVDLTRSDNMILDAVQIYNVANVTDRDRLSTLSIVWSEDGLRCALQINGHSHAPFDFSAEREYCRTNFPNFPDQTPGCWPGSDHSWSDDAVEWMK
jgi:hypothetical protein